MFAQEPRAREFILAAREEAKKVLAPLRMLLYKFLE